MHYVDTSEVTESGAFTSGSHTIQPRTDTFPRTYHGFTCFVAAGSAKFTVYSGLSNTGRVLETFQATGPMCVADIRTTGMKAVNGIFIEHNAGTIDQLTIGYR